MRQKEYQNMNKSILHQILHWFKSLSRSDKIIVGVAVGFSVWLVMFVVIGKLILGSVSFSGDRWAERERLDKIRREKSVAETNRMIADMNRSREEFDELFNSIRKKHEALDAKMSQAMKGLRQKARESMRLKTNFPQTRVQPQATGSSNNNKKQEHP